jgi:predicted 3-demethylubiquinone-9 3-methyltransferase (glyoxalase superfamily)
MMQRITPFLWFDDQAEEAANHYTSIFKNSKIVNIARHGAAGPLPAGTVMTVAFQLDGQEFVALNGGPQYKFTEAISFYVDCETGGSRRVLGEALRRRRKRAVRLA